ncbi:MAG: hypothetical protein NTX03_00020 [Bacteroidetes bacterium]|nr:hypothetical protein [Bacteroidota bacterium]
MQRNRIEILRNMLQTQPDDSFLHYALALEFIAINEGEMATIELDCLLNNHPDYLPAYYQAALFFSGKNEMLKAQEILEKGIALAHKLDDKKTMGELMELGEELG